MPLALVVSSALALTAGGVPGDTARDGGLRWHAPAQCPTTEVVAARARTLGARAAAAEVTVTEVAGGFAAEVDTDGHHRSLRSASCDELATAVALLLAVGVDDPDPSEPTRVEPAPIVPVPDATAAVEPEPGGMDRSGAADRPTPPPARRTTRARLDELRGPFATAFGTIGVGLVPRIDVGGGLGLGWKWRRVAVELGGWVLGPTARATGDVRARMLLGAAAVTACGRIRRAWFELRPCGGVEIGGTDVRTSGTAVQPHARNLWLGVRPALRVLAWFHRRIAPVVSVAAVVPAFRTQYAVGDEVLIATAPVAFSSTLGIEVALGR